MSIVSKKRTLVPRRHSGVVIDHESGEPIVGAVVNVNRIFRNDESRTSELITNDDGNFEFEITDSDLEHRIYLEFDVSHDDFASKCGFGYSYGMLMTNESLGERPFFSKIRLHRAAKITGQVVDKDGLPIGGAKVSSFWMLEDEQPDGCSYQRSLTNPDGSFSVNLCKGGSAYLWIDSSEHAVHQTLFSRTEDCNLGQVQLLEAAEVEFFAKDAKGNALAGVEVRCGDVAAREECGKFVGTGVARTGVTDQSGLVRLKGVRAGTHHVTLGGSGVSNCPGFFPRIIQVEDQEAIQRFEFHAEPHVVFSGRSVNSSGEPRNGHLPSFWVKTDNDESALVESRRTEKGKFIALIPSSTTNVMLSLTTDEHTAFLLEFGETKTTESHLHEVNGASGKEPFDDISITWFDTTILIVNLVGSNGNCYLSGWYAGTPRIGSVDFNYHQSKRKYRSDAVIPNRRIILGIEYFDDAGEIERTVEHEINLKEGETREITIET